MERNIYAQPTAHLAKHLVFCRNCSTPVASDIISCPNCHALNPAQRSKKSKSTASFLALFFGSFGLHRFYLGQWRGLVYIAFFWTFIPGVIAMTEAVIFLASSSESWYKKYGQIEGGLCLTGLLLIMITTSLLVVIIIPQYQSILSYQMTINPFQ